jgi:uncharacterized protein DUF6916
MSDFQSEADFAKNLNTAFHVEVDGTKPIELQLVEVIHRKSEANEQAGMERFSALFAGPLECFLPQQLYRMSHPEMGEFEIFLVPIKQGAEGFKYEAVYNYFRPD